MDVADLPENGLAFLACKGGEIILRAGVTAHFDLIPAAALNAHETPRPRCRPPKTKSRSSTKQFRDQVLVRASTS
jgi:hypothetical protein